MAAVLPASTSSWAKAIIASDRDASSCQPDLFRSGGTEPRKLRRIDVSSTIGGGDERPTPVLSSVVMTNGLLAGAFIIVRLHRERVWCFSSRSRTVRVAAIGPRY
jgi:hypothetical protein